MKKSPGIHGAVRSAGSSRGIGKIMVGVFDIGEFKVEGSSNNESGSDNPEIGEGSLGSGVPCTRSLKTGISIRRYFRFRVPGIFWSSISTGGSGVLSGSRFRFAS